MTRLTSFRLPLTLLAALALGLAGCGSTATPTPTGSSADHDLHVWPELEARLPDSISGRALTTVSLAAHPERQSAKTLSVLRQLGRSPDDLQLANGELEGTDLLVGVMRIVGANGPAIVEAFRAIDAADPDSPASYSVVDLGGKKVTARTVSLESAYLYGVEDMMFIVSGERSLVEAALQKLP